MVITTVFANNVLAIDRPSIWVTAADKPVIFNKIMNNEWAKKRFVQLQNRTAKKAPKLNRDRKKSLSQFPLDWDKDTGKFPAFIKQARGYPKESRNILQSALQDGVDCGVLYYLTSDNQYAKCAADILHTVVQGLNNTELDTSLKGRYGWIMPDDHLLESRIYAAQIPIIYDFVYNYLKAGNDVYDVYLDDYVEFDFAAAQTVFKTYAQLTLDVGLINNNWPVLESPSLVHNALAIDDENIRNKYLSYYLFEETKYQDSLTKVAKSYVNAGDIWPESLNYSMTVANWSLYLMTILDRIYPLELGNKFPNIASALLTYKQLQFPNNEYPSFGDGDRRYKSSYPDLEIAYLSATLNKNQMLIDVFANELKAGVKSKTYKRDKISHTYGSASIYHSPLELLWAVADLGDKPVTEFVAPRTVDIPFAGIFIQRNLETLRNKKYNGLMAMIGGASYVHGHASGIDMELYGRGHVLGINAGKADYSADVHKNYHRIFAAHNTVISNGASASSGKDWVGLGMNKVQKEAMEPEPRQPAVSQNYSFVTASFHDEFNLLKEAHHQRTTALIRLGDTDGYYIDIFRAKSDTPEQYHDYLYHNKGDEIIVNNQGQAVSFKDDIQRFSASKKLSSTRTEHQHPGWHFFTDIKTSSVISNGLDVQFKANALKKDPVTMHAFVVEGLDVSISKALSPNNKSENKPYNTKPIPLMVLRHQGDAWVNPFAVVYEPKESQKKPTIRSVERIMDKGEFKGLQVHAQVGKRKIEQFILIQEELNERYLNPNLGIEFTGHFAVITLENGQLAELYIGQGNQLTYQDDTLNVSDGKKAAYKDFE
nr:heparinase II/III family protein [Paraglaciecola sp. G1-23]